jgi:hypothetical protein
MILAEIKEKLLEIDPIVFYGAVNPNEIETVWDYIVFERKVTKPSTNQTGYSHYFTVHIIRENFVPEGLELDVIAKMKEIPGMKLSSNDMTYDYTVKPSTDAVVEMLSIDFVRAVKV